MSEVRVEAGYGSRRVVVMFEPPSRAVVKDRSLNDWLTWARDKLAAADPLLMGAERIFTDIAEVKSWTYHD